MIVSGEAVARFVSEGLGFGLCPPYAAIGIERNGEITAGVLLNHFEGEDVHLTAYGKGWTRALLNGVGAYIFDTLGAQRFTMVTKDDEVARLAEKLGGQIEGRMRSHYGAGQDGIVIGVLRGEYRY